jgi:hypothetical protein
VVSFEAFLKWAEDRFDDVVVSNKEIKVNSPFADDDHKFHMWCSPSGGKHDRPHGVYRCFKTEKVGTLVGLVMQVDHCTFDEAIEILGGNQELHDLEDRLHEFIHGLRDEDLQGLPEAPKEKPTLQLPENSVLISEMWVRNRRRIQASLYLLNRKIPIDGFFYCLEGKYKERIVIPYHDREGNLIYWNTRYIGTWEKAPKYLGPPKDTGVGKSDVVYMREWPSLGSTLHLTEGEFDAISLSLSGFNGAAVGGGYMGDNQFRILKGFRLVICGDNDSGKKSDAGLNAVCRIGNALLENGIRDVGYVRPPMGYKDWNDLLIKFNSQLVQKYVLDHAKPFNEVTSNRLRSGKV